MTAPSPAPVSMYHSVEIETPELVTVSYTIAGAGSRAAAAIVDYLICIASFLALLAVFAFFDIRVFGRQDAAVTTAWAVAIIGLVQFSILWLYYVLFEALMDGQTPGKRLLRLRVVRDGGLSVTFGASAVRNLVRIVDMQPLFLYAVGLVSSISNRLGKRLGDFAAGTLVVREALVSQPIARSAKSAATKAAPVLHAALTDAEFDVLERFIQRRMQLQKARRDELAHQLASRFASSLTDSPDGSDITRLGRLYDAEQAARARGVAARHDTGAARERHAIIAASAGRWATFANTLNRAQYGGLASLGEEGVREFVRDYRELTADLARLRTATRGREASEVFYLNRLVATAHNLLYRRRTVHLSRIVTYLFGDVPSEIRRSVIPIGIAAGMLFLPMIIAGTAVANVPGLADRMLPPHMLDRAERGVVEARRGGNYIEDPEVYRPVMASRIMANNIQVAFFAFAFGITAGVMTLWLLLVNGVSIGSVFGLYASKDIGTLLLAFVAPHGVLELTAICIAGGAGLLLGSALIVPGPRTRRRALVENGRRAITLIAGATLLLVFAGAIEGFVSPNRFIPYQGKLAVSAATAVVLVLFLAMGTKSRPAPSAPGSD